LFYAGLKPAAFAALVPNSANKPLYELIEEITGDHEMLVGVYFLVSMFITIFELIVMWNCLLSRADRRTVVIKFPVNSRSTLAEHTHYRCECT